MNPRNLSCYAALNHRDLGAKLTAHNVAVRAAGDRPQRRVASVPTLRIDCARARWPLASLAALTLVRAH